jgi:leukotriene-A4 hydrolase
MSDVMADPCSLANVTELRTRALHLDIALDFEAKVLSGSVALTLVAVAPTRQLVLDTRDLTINAVHLADGTALEWALGERNEALGTPLCIQLGADAAVGAELSVSVSYSTSPNSMAIQWLPPSQTAGGEKPYMFTQCQAIHARGMVPCQDSPGVKSPYTASLTVPDGLVGLMSAVCTAFPAASEAGEGGRRTFQFEQKVPMASYLLAIAAGNLEKRDVVRLPLPPIAAPSPVSLLRVVPVVGGR